MSEQTKISGSCHCSAINYQSTGDFLMTALCHCQDCQKITGGTSWPFAVVMKDSLEISGKTAQYSREAPSGNQVIMHFCPTCGSTLFGQPNAWSEIMTVSASSLDDPSIYKPKCHVWTKEAPKWECFINELPTFSENATAEDVAQMANT